MSQSSTNALSIFIQSRCSALKAGDLVDLIGYFCNFGV